MGMSFRYAVIRQNELAKVGAPRQRSIGSRPARVTVQLRTRMGSSSAAWGSESTGRRLGNKR